MTTVRFGVACDGPGCPHVWNDYAIPEDVAECETCGDDFCPACIPKTGHVIVRKADEGHRAIVECATESNCNEGGERGQDEPVTEPWAAGTRGHSTRAALEGDPLPSEGTESATAKTAPRAGGRTTTRPPGCPPHSAVPGGDQHAGSAGAVSDRKPSCDCSPTELFPGVKWHLPFCALIQGRVSL